MTSICPCNISLSTSSAVIISDVSVTEPVSGDTQRHLSGSEPRGSSRLIPDLPIIKSVHQERSASLEGLVPSKLCWSNRCVFHSLNLTKRIACRTPFLSSRASSSRVGKQSCRSLSSCGNCSNPATPTSRYGLLGQRLEQNY